MLLNSPTRPPPQPSPMTVPPLSSTTTPAMMVSQSLPSMPSSSLATTSTTTLLPSAFTALPPSSLQSVISDPSALILDIRPHNLYLQLRVSNSLSLSVPSTLLKRPNFPLTKLAEMLPTSLDRDKFSRWPQASRILVYDADSAALPPNLQTTNLLGLMRKFRSEGYPAVREIAWLRGGFNAVVRDFPHLLQRGPPPDEHDEDESPGELETDGDRTSLGRPNGSSAAARVLRARQLPQSAFTSTTTIPLRPRSMQPPSVVPMQFVPPTPATQSLDPSSRTLPFSTPAPSVAPPPIRAGIQGRADFALRLPPGLVRPKTMIATTPEGVPRGPLYSMPTLSPSTPIQVHTTEPQVILYQADRLVAFNPFFDTIRQNIELGNRDPTRLNDEGIPLKLPRRVRRCVGELPFEWLRQIARKSRRVTESSSSSSAVDSDSSSEDDIQGAEELITSEGPSTSKASSESAMRTPSTVIPRSRRMHVSAAAHRSPKSSLSSSPSRPIPMRTPPRRDIGSDSSPPSPTSSAHSRSPPDADHLTRALEMQFYKIELGEQKRLLGVMERHTMESGKVVNEGHGIRGSLGVAGLNPHLESKRVGDDDKVDVLSEDAVPSFPYSITAGLEKGAKNRYRNIWPFEHARVRLRKAKADDDDYMNASYVQPLGTTKRYIATQGPLPTTFTDFWTLCWEQNVHVIVMLTREIEGSTVKCGKYWAEGSYGPLRLRLLETNDTPERERQRQESETSGGFFISHVPQPKTKLKPKTKARSNDGDVAMDPEETPSTIKRVFELTNTAYPLAPPRIVTQFQYLEWPDLNVPSDPRGVLELIRQVENTVDQARSSGQKPWGEGPLYRTSVPQSPVGLPGQAINGSTLPSTSGRTSDEVDAITGVALIAQENPPVLLHCSAGVGRTGGFIAVDAVLDGVRREMRKRKEGQVEETAQAQAASAFGQGRSGTASRSNSRSIHSRSMSIVSQTPEPMDVDTSPSPPTQMGPTLTMAVAVGNSEVHVPVAGFAEADRMDVDPSREDVTCAPVPIPIRATLPPPLLQASPELVAEVRHATVNAWPSMSPTTPRFDLQAAEFRIPRDPTPSVDHSSSSVDSDAAQSSLRSAALRTRTRSFASPPTSHAESSTSIMVGKTAKLSMASPSPPSNDAPLPSVGAGRGAGWDPRMRTLSLPSSTSSNLVGRSESEQGQPPSRPSLTSQHRLNSWRSEVRSSSEAGSAHANPLAAPSPPSTAFPLASGASAASTASSLPAPAKNRRSSKDTDSDGGRSKVFSDREPEPTSPSTPSGLREPRRLHDSSSPPLLSAYDEPIRRVVEDMREQRMSLCQSLRQYVFVHRAIIEGALMLVDEEKRRSGAGAAAAGEERSPRKVSSSSSQSRRAKRAAGEHKDMEVAPEEVTLPGPEVAPPSSAVSDGTSDRGSNRGGARLASPFAPDFPAEREVARKRSVPEFVAGNTIIEGVVADPSVPTITVASPRSKRSASPTELPMEGVDGGVLLTKRPSLKRRQRTMDGAPFPVTHAAVGVEELDSTMAPSSMSAPNAGPGA
ncbi:hypothetical protein C8Q80DRAFT_1265629 [Daedaleopsis nitida]|nr:hypothetical protein C8Q80DRAFT_1265629 [Daedaleopsis nitida]